MILPLGTSVTYDCEFYFLFHVLLDFTVYAFDGR
jgi:hypothetical protein